MDRIALLMLVLGFLTFAAVGFGQRLAAEEFPHDPKQAVFPPVKGSNLNEKEFQLPQDFEGELNLVLMAYVQRQQFDVNTWLPLAAQLKNEVEGLRYYELPVLATYAPAAQKFIDNGMRSGIPDPAVRAITITLYINQKSFLKALHLESMDSIHAVLVDRKGRVYWKAEGRLTPEKEASLRAAIWAARK
ncbi:MAG: hypothetical protein SFX74_13445 [Fimbriimonadaceae bacterium]|nr:hypothetical protein [Fimbriimonadaceae bacterium]